jgi:hypothetical protein
VLPGNAGREKHPANPLEKSLYHISKYSAAVWRDSVWLTQVRIPKDLAMTE